MAKALVMCIEYGSLGTTGGLDLTMNVSYAGPDVSILVQNDLITANILYSDTLAVIASNIITAVVDRGLSQWGLTVARTDVLIPSFQWGT
jgi:hypothetical protein